MKVSKEVLNQYIYDLGYSKALKFWQLSDLQAENILYNKVINRKPEAFIEPVEEDKVEIDIEQAAIIWAVIKKYYKYLRKLYIKGNSKNTINVRSESSEDKFQNSLIRIVERLDRFEYISDEKTLEYIKSRLFFEKRTDRTTEYRLNKKVSFIYDSETIINNIPNDNN